MANANIHLTDSDVAYKANGGSFWKIQEEHYQTCKECQKKVSEHKETSTQNQGMRLPNKCGSSSKNYLRNIASVV